MDWALVLWGFDWGLLGTWGLGLGLGLDNSWSKVCGLVSALVPNLLVSLGSGLASHSPIFVYKICWQINCIKTNTIFVAK